VGRAWRERLLTTLLVVVVAVPVGIVIGGGLDFDGAGVEDGASVVAGAEGTTTTTTTEAPTTTAVSPNTTAPPMPAARPPEQVKLRFSNGSRTAGAAVTVGDRLAALGYRVLPAAPSPSKPVAATVITYRDGFASEAKAVAVALGLGPDAATPIAGATGPADVLVVVADDVVAALLSPPPG
jgi:hypothetical protein